MDRGAHGVPRVGHDLVTEPPPPPQNYSRGWRDHTELSGIVLRTVLQLVGTQKALLSFISGHYQLDGKTSWKFQTPKQWYLPAETVEAAQVWSLPHCFLLVAGTPSASGNYRP